MLFDHILIAVATRSEWIGSRDTVCYNDLRECEAVTGLSKCTEEDIGQLSIIFSPHQTLQVLAVLTCTDIFPAERVSVFDHFRFFQSILTGFYNGGL